VAAGSDDVARRLSVVDDDDQPRLRACLGLACSWCVWPSDPLSGERIKY